MTEGLIFTKQQVEAKGKGLLNTFLVESESNYDFFIGTLTSSFRNRTIDSDDRKSSTPRASIAQFDTLEAKDFLT